MRRRSSRAFFELRSIGISNQQSKVSLLQQGNTEGGLLGIMKEHPSCKSIKEYVPAHEVYNKSSHAGTLVSRGRPPLRPRRSTLKTRGAHCTDSCLLPRNCSGLSSYPLTASEGCKRKFGTLSSRCAAFITALLIERLNVSLLLQLVAREINSAGNSRADTRSCLGHCTATASAT